MLRLLDLAQHPRGAEARPPPADRPIAGREREDVRVERPDEQVGPDVPNRPSPKNWAEPRQCAVGLHAAGNDGAPGDRVEDLDGRGLSQGKVGDVDESAAGNLDVDRRSRRILVRELRAAYHGRAEVRRGSRVEDAVERVAGQIRNRTRLRPVGGDRVGHVGLQRNGRVDDDQKDAGSYVAAATGTSSPGPTMRKLFALVAVAMLRGLLKPKSSAVIAVAGPISRRLVTVGPMMFGFVSMIVAAAVVDVSGLLRSWGMRAGGRRPHSFGYWGSPARSG